MLRRALRIRKPVLLPILIGGLLALASVSPAVAAPPSTQDLNPAPPDFYTCNPVGAGTICRAHTVDPYEGEHTGIFCGSGAASSRSSTTASATSTRPGGTTETAT